ncbi:hypothetical protein FEM48_Zijuj10G0144000 [Ziziphus jujuba var. spinosa]|uniref:Pentatricopeptide repeat-containing protein n=1 Tax=Ziziphus jujuba var. spinosa TaxID=714518 RepID=A0A978UNX0_ZIZJJ|nr:hypothetical protein FEM48_Zijuj10G0144000 [Ziziphus jujuba var. spinosa]
MDLAGGRAEVEEERLFDLISYPNVAIWNSMFRGYAKNECHKETIVLFRRMKSLDIVPNCFTFPIVIKSCGKIDASIEGEEVHCALMRDGFTANPFVERLFDLAPQRDIVLWNTVISGYIELGNVVAAQKWM